MYVSGFGSAVLLRRRWWRQWRGSDWGILEVQVDPQAVGEVMEFSMTELPADPFLTASSPPCLVLVWPYLRLT